MIKITDTEVHGIETAFKAMRNPMDSWMKASPEGNVKLAKSLVNLGDDHGKFSRFITVTAAVLAPLYWWKEFDTYKVGTVRLSSSTMHTLHKQDLTLDDFSTEGLDGCSVRAIRKAIDRIEILSRDYALTSDKNDLLQMYKVLPSCFNQLSTISLNYQVLRRIYHQRKKHILPEWHTFCEWIETLPQAEVLIL